MTTVQISPHVELQEERALVALLRQRNLLLAQLVSALQEQAAELTAEIASLQEQLMAQQDREVAGDGA